METLLTRARQGDGDALEALLAGHRARLRRMIAARLDPRMRSRVDPSDIVQETCIEAVSRLQQDRDAARLPFFLWLRLLASDKIADACRKHLGAKSRDVRREGWRDVVERNNTGMNALSEAFVDLGTTPSEAAIRAERVGMALDALTELPEGDREIVYLRHFEELTRSEAAAALGISESAGAQRYLRALAKLREKLGPELSKE